MGKHLILFTLLDSGLIGLFFSFLSFFLSIFFFFPKTWNDHNESLSSFGRSFSSSFRLATSRPSNWFFLPSIVMEGLFQEEPACRERIPRGGRKGETLDLISPMHSRISSCSRNISEAPTDRVYDLALGHSRKIPFRFEWVGDFKFITIVSRVNDRTWKFLDVVALRRNEAEDAAQSPQVFINLYGSLIHSRPNESDQLCFQYLMILEYVPKSRSERALCHNSTVGLVR